MATNKHAQIRYNTLDKCFRNTGRNYTITDLLEECNRAIIDFDSNAEGIKKRQLFDDIRYMQSSQGWEIVLNENLKFGRKKIYRYLDTNFSISNQGLNEADANHLKAALVTLSRFIGLPQFDWIQDLSLRLEDSFGLTKKVHNIISFDENLYLKGKEFITELYDAIHYKKVLNVKYQNFKSNEPSLITLHPYYLKQYNNRWFLLGKNTDFDNLTNLALDRIEHIQETDIDYIDTDIDFEEYFEDIVGVTLSDDSVEKIILKVSAEAINYIITKPLHGSQKMKERSDEYAIIELNVIPNYELLSQILSFGEGIEIVEPQYLRDRLKERIDLMKNKYKN